MAHLPQHQSQMPPHDIRATITQSKQIGIRVPNSTTTPKGCLFFDRKLVPLLITLLHPPHLVYLLQSLLMTSPLHHHHLRPHCLYLLIPPKYHNGAWRDFRTLIIDYRLNNDRKYIHSDSGLTCNLFISLVSVNPLFGCGSEKPF